MFSKNWRVNCYLSKNGKSNGKATAKYIESPAHPKSAIYYARIALHRPSLPYSALIWIRLWVRGRKAPAYRKRGVNVTVFTAIR